MQDRSTPLAYTGAMHWFWRATLAFLAGWAVRLLFGLGMAYGYRLSSPSRVAIWIGWVSIIASCLQLAAVILVYGLLTRRYYASRPGGGETLCRRCGYILRGISEPRCPECGERI